MSSSYRRRGGVATASALVLAAIASPLAVPAASASVFVTALIPITSATRATTLPGGLAFDPGTNRAYVANRADDSVSVIDTNTNAVIAVIPHGPDSIGSTPTAVAADPPRHQMYVANDHSDSVSVIDTTTNTVKAVLPYDRMRGIGEMPSAVDVDPERGRAYVTNSDEDSVSVIDTSTNAVIGVITSAGGNAVGDHPSDVAIDTGLHRAYVSSEGDGKVAVIDTTTDRLIGVISGDTDPGFGGLFTQIAVDSGTHRAFVAGYESGTVSVIDTTNNSVITILKTDKANGIGPNPFSVGIDTTSHQAYISSETQITAINTATLAVTRVIKRSSAVDYGDDITGIAMDPVHHKALVSGFRSNTVGVIDLDSTAPLTRRGGADRFEVSALNSRSEFSPGVGVAYVASGAAFADALSGSAAAGSRGAPVLLVTTDGIPTAIGAELARLKPKRIIILGGTTSVGDGVQRALRNYAPTVDRLGGADRYAVSVAVSHDNFAPGIPVAYLASGAVFPDALSGSAVAANNGGPVLLTSRDALPQTTVDELARLKPGRIVILDGTNTVSAAVQAQLQATTPVTRVGGADRFEVSANASASTFTGGVNIAYVASGVVFPDALSGSPVAAANGAPVLLVGKDEIPQPVARELDRLNPAQIVVLGGPNSVSDTVYEQLRSHLR